MSRLAVLVLLGLCGSLVVLAEEEVTAGDKSAQGTEEAAPGGKETALRGKSSPNAAEQPAKTQAQQATGEEAFDVDSLDFAEDLEDETLEPIGEQELRGLHQRIDKDGNGKASMAEVMVFADLMLRESSKKDIEPLMKDIDKNHDGKLSYAEYMKEIDLALPTNETEQDRLFLKERHRVETKKFTAADTDGDKFLDVSEFPSVFFPETNEKVLSVEVEETLRLKDADKDGRLTLAEFFETPADKLDDFEKEEFKQLDKDGDGFLSIGEVASWESGSFHTEQAFIELFKVADKDHDGHVSAEELVKARQQIAELQAHEQMHAWLTDNEL